MGPGHAKILRLAIRFKKALRRNRALRKLFPYFTVTVVIFRNYCRNDQLSLVPSGNALKEKICGIVN